jgi:hydroxypyruvate isomerase
MAHSLRYEVNCSILFTELPVNERAAAAKAAGFDAVEFWWPFATAVPDDADVDGASPQQQDDLAAENLALAAKAAAAIDGVVFVEPVSGADRYPLRRAADAIAVIDRVRRESGATNLGFLCDLYHLATNGDDLDDVISQYAARTAHVQVADSPGRGEPGTGHLDIDGYLGKLAAAGYEGWVGLEYKPTSTSADSFGWLPRERRRSAADLTPTPRSTP